MSPTRPFSLKRWQAYKNAAAVDVDVQLSLSNDYPFEGPLGSLYTEENVKELVLEHKKPHCVGHIKIGNKSNRGCTAKRKYGACNSEDQRN